MQLDTKNPDVTIVRYRPHFAPAFSLMFVCVGLWQLIARSLDGRWDQNAAFGTAVSLILGSGFFFYSFRRDEYRFDEKRATLFWDRRGLLHHENGAIEFSRIREVAVHTGPEGGDTLSRVVLKLTDDELFPLANAFTCDTRTHRDVAARLSEVLGRARKAA